jgi:hypothetical protein
METQKDTNASRKTYADKLCLAAIISLLIGIGSFLLCLDLDRFIHHHWPSFENVYLTGTNLWLGLICLVVPFLALAAIINVLTNWRVVTNPDDSVQNRDLLHKTARNFFITSILFALISLFSIVWLTIIMDFQNANLLLFGGIWLIAMSLMALVMGLLSYKLFAKDSAQFHPHVGAVFSVIISLVAVLVVFSKTSVVNYLIQRVVYTKLTETFTGNSSSLKQTSVMPTLDSPCPKNKNVIWCSSFQLAWNRMKDDVINAPVEVVGAGELAARLNKAKQSEADMESDSFYAAAGRVKEGIINKIQKEMTEKFPSHSVPDFNDIAGFPIGILAYSYLTVNVPFKYPFRQFRDEFAFTDSQGIETDVGAFGVWGRNSVYDKMRQQVEILYYYENRDGSERDSRIKEFAVDLCRHSNPYQVVAAVVEPKASLDQTLDYIRGKITDSRQEKNYEQTKFLDYTDILKVPEMFWEIEHDFDELVGKIVANANHTMPIIKAKQGMKFKLDRCGAMLESEATIMVAAIPRYFIFNRPFLIYLKKRDCEQPFFVMWVDNAELLNRK